MRTALAWLYAAAILVVTASAISVLVNPGRNPTIAVISACAGVVVLAVIGVGAVLEAEMRQSRELLRDIRDRLRGR
jgi:hypothetical protein